MRGSEPLANIWLKKTAEEKLPTKADSLPRNIQLNDHIEETQAKHDTTIPDEKIVAPEEEDQPDG